MSNIILFEEKPSAQVSVIYEAIDKGVLCTGLNDHNLYEILKVAATAAYRDLGYDLPPDDDLKYILLGVIRKIRHKKLTLRDREIMIAFQNGVQGDYGKFFGLNVVSFVFFLTSHATHPDRLTALSQRNNPEEPKKEPPTLEEQFNTSKINAIEGYKLFLSETYSAKDAEGERVIFGSSGRFGAVTFDFFYNIEVFLITQEEIDDIMARGKELHYHELKIKRSKEVSDIKRKDTEKKIEQLVNSLQVENETEPELNPLVVAAAKRIYINELFQGFYAEEMTAEDLEKMINDLKK